MPAAISSNNSRALRCALTTLLSPHSFDSRDEWMLESIRSLKRLLNAQKGAIRLRTALGLVMISEDHDPGALKDYLQYYHRFDYGRAIPGALARPRQVWTIEDQYGPNLGDYYRSEYYNDYQHPHRMYHCVATGTDRCPADSDAIIYFHRDKLSAQAFGRETKSIMRLIAPALSAGVKLSGMTGPSYGPFLGVIDDLRDGCALFTPSGLLLHRNPALSSLVNEQSHSAELWTCILSSVRSILGLCGPANDSSQPISSGSREIGIGGETYIISGCVLGFFHDANEPAILISVRRSGQLHTSPSDLREKFNLSGREEHVARLLAKRLTTSEIAGQLGISAHTVRHHTERVFAKIGVASRRDVAAALFRDA